MLLIHAEPIVKKQPKDQTIKNESFDPAYLNRTDKSLKEYFSAWLRKKRLSGPTVPRFSPEKAFKVLTRRITEENE
jgi:hypothetical protein